jgi:hypothetical protein
VGVGKLVDNHVLARHALQQRPDRPRVCPRQQGIEALALGTELLVQRVVAFGRNHHLHVALRGPLLCGSPLRGLLLCGSPLRGPLLCGSPLRGPLLCGGVLTIGGRRGGTRCARREMRCRRTAHSSLHLLRPPAASSRAIGQPGRATGNGPHLLCQPVDLRVGELLAIAHAQRLEERQAPLIDVDGTDHQRPKVVALTRFVAADPRQVERPRHIGHHARAP